MSVDLRELPTGWQWTDLETLAGSDGVVSDGDWVESKDQNPSGKVRLLQLADVGEQKFINKSKRFMDSARADEMNCLFLNKGDLLIARLGDPVGKACTLPEQPQRCVTVVDVMVFRACKIAMETQNYVAYAINSPRIRNRINEQLSGTTRKRITGKKLKKTLFPLPPLEEQERIVDKIDELFSGIEAGERAIEQARAGVARYRKAILKAAVTGELTADWRDENPTEESAKDLLARILTARFEAWETSELAKLDAKGKARPETEKQWEKFRARYKPPVKPFTDGYSEVPESWINTTVDQLSEFITSGSRGWAKYYSDTGAVFVRVGNLNRSSVEIDFEKLQFVSPPDGAEGARTRLVLNDILISITADVGMVGVFRDQYSEAYINQHVALVRVPDEVNQDWISWAIVSPTKQQEILGTGRGATKDGLTLSDLRELVVPFPPESEQVEIVNRVEQALSKADAVEATLDAQSRAAKALKQAVLKTAFEGKLVPQNPKDEPASELLKRIKAAS